MSLSAVLSKKIILIQKPYKCEVPHCPKRYTDPSSLRKHVKNHSKEEQDQYKVCRERSLENQNSQQSQVNMQWVDQELNSNLGLVAEYYNPAGYNSRAQEPLFFRPQETIEYRLPEVGLRPHEEFSPQDYRRGKTLQFTHFRMY